VEELIQVKCPFDPQKQLERELRAEIIAGWKEQLYKALVDEFRGVQTRKILRRILGDDNNDGLAWLLSSSSERFLKRDRSLYIYKIWLRRLGSQRASL
jgi:hypothetical protein